MSNELEVEHVAQDATDIAAFEKAADVEMKDIPIAQIKVSEIALREGQRGKEEYLTLLESVRRFGVLQSILVREIKDPISGAVSYGLIDGCQRYTASLDAGKATIPCRIVNFDDAEALEAQIMLNATRVTTRAADFGNGLVRVMARNLMMTPADLAAKVSQSVSWVLNMMSLSRLDPHCQEMVNTGKVPLGNAYILAKIPKEEQADWLDAAMNEAPATFSPRAKARIKEIKESKKTGADVGSPTFVAVRHMRKFVEIESELEAGSACAKLLANAGLKGADAQAAFRLALDWVTHYDQFDQEEQKNAFDARKRKQEEDAKLKKEKKDADRAAKAKADAANPLAPV